MAYNFLYPSVNFISLRSSYSSQHFLVEHLWPLSLPTRPLDLKL